MVTVLAFDDAYLDAHNERVHRRDDADVRIQDASGMGPSHSISRETPLTLVTGITMYKIEGQSKPDIRSRVLCRSLRLWSDSLRMRMA